MMRLGMLAWIRSDFRTEEAVNPWIDIFMSVLKEHVQSSLFSDVHLNFAQKGDASDTLGDLTSNIQDLSIKTTYLPINIAPSIAEVESVKELTGLAKATPDFLILHNHALKLTRSQSNPYTATNIQDYEACTLANPTTSTITSVACLTGAEAIQRVIELTLSLSNLPSFAYIPGDAIGVICPNPDKLVLNLLRILKIEPERFVIIDALDGSTCTFSRTAPTTNYDILRWRLDLHAFPKKSFFRMLSMNTSDPTDKRKLQFLSSTQGTKALRRIKEEAPNIIDILASFPTIQLTLQDLLQNILPLQPRFYSICSSSLDSSDTLKIAFNVAKYKRGDRDVNGLCSTWLDELTGQCTIARQDLATTVDIPIFIKKRTDMLLKCPSDGNRLVMIGAGTGITPFVSIINEAAHTRSDIPLLWLFQGCRYNDDALYASHLSQCTHLKHSIAYSRIEPKQYVQDQIRGHAVELREWASSGAKIYVCGSLAMAKDVHSALVEVFSADGTDGLAMLLDMMSRRDYIREIWG